MLHAEVQSRVLRLNIRGGRGLAVQIRRVQTGTLAQRVNQLSAESLDFAVNSCTGGRVFLTCITHAQRGSANWDRSANAPTAVFAVGKSGVGAGVLCALIDTVQFGNTQVILSLSSIFFAA